MGKILGDGSRFALAGRKGDGLDSSDGGDNFDNMEARLVRLETLAEVTERRLVGIESDTHEIRKDIHRLKYWMIGVMVAAVMAIFGTMGGGYVRLDSKIDAKFDKLDAKMDARFQQADAKIEALSAKIDAKIDKLIERLPAPASPAR